MQTEVVAIRDVAQCQQLAAFLEDRIYEFNAIATGYFDGMLLAGCIRSDAGEIIAGFNGHTWGRCCELAHVWVHEQYRGRGLGTQLLRSVEAEAVARGCLQVVLATHSFQAPGFYERMGYQRRYTIEGNPKDHADIIYIKILQSENVGKPLEKSTLRRQAMVTVKSVPEGVQAVFPMLICHSPEAEMNFCAAAFGAVEQARRPGPDGSPIHIALRINDAFLVVQSEFPDIVASRTPIADGSSPVVIFVYVANVDLAVERAVAAGAKILLPAQNQFWGDRTARILDPSGHVWTVASRIEESTEEQRAKRWSDIQEAGQQE